MEQQAWIVPDEYEDKFLFAKVSLSPFDRRVQLEVIRDNEIHEMTLQEAEQLAKALMSAVEAVKG